MGGKSIDTHNDFQSQPFLSIIIPAFNEEQRLPSTLRQVSTFVESQDFLTEVIVVDNASTDLTQKIIVDFVSQYPFVKYFYEAIRGKGAAIRTGIMAGQGEYLLICDADLAVPIEEARKFLPPQLTHFDVVIGSREAPGSHRYGEPFYRHLMGRIFNIVVQWLVLPGIRDSQCGFKCFRRTIAHDLFKTNKIIGWVFDVEILYISRLRRYQIIEVPVTWYYGEESKVKPITDSWRMLKEVMKVWRNGRKGLYT